MSPEEVEVEFRAARRTVPAYGRTLLGVIWHGINHDPYRKP